MRKRTRLCLIGNPDSIHVRRWASHFASRGFDVHLLSYYSPEQEAPAEVSLHFLRERRPSGRRQGRSRSAMQRFPGALRVVNSMRLIGAGFASALRKLEPDLVHAHYVSDYGFLAMLAGRHPLVVSAWGSDLLVDPQRSVITRRLVKWVLARSDLITYDAEQVAEAARRLGAPPGRLLEVVLGVEDAFLKAADGATPAAQRDPIIVSLRSLERPLYNVELIVRAMPEVLRRVPDARLIIGNDGALRNELDALASTLGIRGSVEFLGMVRRPIEIAQVLGLAALYVSVPSSDGTSVTLLEAMAAGAYPIVSDLPSNRAWIDSSNGEIVAMGSTSDLSEAIVRGLTDPGRRAAAAQRNLELVRQRGLWEQNMARVEDAYLNLVTSSRRRPDQ